MNQIYEYTYIIYFTILHFGLNLIVDPKIHSNMPYWVSFLFDLVSLVINLVIDLVADLVIAVINLVEEVGNYTNFGVNFGASFASTDYIIIMEVVNYIVGLELGCIIVVVN